MIGLLCKIIGLSTPGLPRLRSKSDGAESLQPPHEPFEIFPNLPDEVLKKMDLLGHEPRERLTEDEVEQKFVSLALAFSIDAATIKDRCERQRRYRDQTETNLSVEIDRLVEKLTYIQPLCVDAQTTELLTNLLEQVDVVTNASNLAAISAERFGAVQHEQRLSDSVNLMINHVSTLKQQRDSARRHLHYTKKVLQDTHASEGTNPKQRSSPVNGKIITKRRASIATICGPQEANVRITTDPRKITRRTSDFSLRTSARTSRPSRLELGLELNKIKEGSVEEVPNVDEIKDQKICENNDNNSSQENCQIENVDVSNLPIKQRLIHRIKRFNTKVEKKYKEWIEDNTLHEILCFSALMCFSLGIITLGNLFIELECSKRGIPSSYCFVNIGSLWTSITSKEFNEEYIP